jgi:hypothetical protein
MVPLFVSIAPDVAIEFHRNGKKLQLTGKHDKRWSETSLAIGRLGVTDKEAAKAIVSEKFPELLDALYDLSLESERHIIRFFKILFELSPELFDHFVVAISLDDHRCLKLVQQLVSNQPRELVRYRRLARRGMKVPGELGALSARFFERLQT